MGTTENKIKVLQIIDKYSFGGVETIVYTLINKFISKDIAIFYYFLRDTGHNKKIIRNNILIGNSSKWNIYQLYRMVKIIKKEKIHIIHTHHRKGFYLACILSCFLKSKKFVHHEHGDIFLRIPFYELCFKLFSNNIDKVIVVSEVGKNELQRKTKFDERKIVVLNNFVDLEKFNCINYSHSYITDKKESLGIRKKEFVIGFVGRLSEVKGIDCLIKAVSFLNFDYKVLIVGDGILRKKCEELADILKIRDHIIFLGYFSQPSRIYPLFDVLVAPSTSESFPLTVLEAQAMKVPVISSNIAAFRNILTNFKTAIFFEKEYAKDLADKIKLINTDKELRKRLTNEGFKHVQQFPLDKYLQSLRKIYYEVQNKK